jgi:hypothetical protein
MRHSNGVDTIGYVPNAYGAGTITIAADGLFRVLVGGTISMRANQAPAFMKARSTSTLIFNKHPTAY